MIDLVLRKNVLIVLLQICSFCALEAQNKIAQTDTTLTVLLPNGAIKVQVCSDKIIRIIHSPVHSFRHDTSLVVQRSWGKTKFSVDTKKELITINTKFLKIKVNPRGSVSISDTMNNLLFSEDEFNPFTFLPEKISDEKTYNARLYIELAKNEGVYGLGQYQNGVMNYRGHNLNLVQENTQVAVPFMLSTKLYALMFDNYSKIIFHDRQDTTYFWFEVADVIDYYFIAGKDMDDVISGYRQASGQAPMLSKWAYGYWQSKERYKSQEEVLSIAKEFREQKIPIDNIVQDWMYWGEDWAYWNSMNFDSARYPDPKAMINLLHNKYNMHIMFSIWPVPGQKTKLYKELESKGLLFGPYHWTDGRTYDAYSPEARKLYWNAVNKGLFSLGADAFWMDASEPEVLLAPNERSTKEIKRTTLGSIYRYLNTYSLVHTQGLYEGQRSVTSDKRVAIVTRSAFLGQQRYAATTWSGDIVADWDVYKYQIAGGLNFCMSGLPYWSNDIGGFHIRRYGGFPSGSKDPGYRELYVRWFQYGSFNPIFRSHGTDAPREPWQFGEPGSWAYDAIIKYDRLRYRLMPYIYSLGWAVTNNGYTIMRALPMDFPSDIKTHNINDQFMFGPALLVNPVTQHMYYGESYKNELIPSQRLMTKDGRTGRYNAQYFNGINFDTLMVDSVQTDLLFDMYIGKDMPPIVNWERNSIRWTGQFKTRNEGEYEFWLTTDDAIRLYIDGKELVDQWNNKGIDTTYRIKLKLNAETWYPFKVEYSRQANASKFRLGWRTPDMTEKSYDSEKELGIRKVYLPFVKGGWYDFWTGENVAGGKNIKKQVPIDIMPLYVRAGSIIPMGPEIQYASEKEEPIELRIYPGADAEFLLYDDEGNNYNYEKGLYSIIPLQWNESSQILTIGQRKGSFPGMHEHISFNIMWVKRDHGIGVDVSSRIDKSVIYNGEKLILKR